ncbi:MAG: PAS domain S-box protein [Calditrichaeota bacterium]|nr:MAG: PAS domain S-box protein [Calditrichota bacterium]
MAGKYRGYLYLDKSPLLLAPSKRFARSGFAIFEIQPDLLMNNPSKKESKPIDELQALQNRIDSLEDQVNTLKKNLSEDQIKFREQEETYRFLFDYATDAIYVQDKNGYFLDVNKGAEDMYGYTKDELIGKTPDFVSAPDKNDPRVISEHIKKAYEGIPQSFEFWGRDKAGRIFPKEVRLKKGKYFGRDVILAFARDITKKLKYDLARRQNEERLHSLYEHAPIGIVYIDPADFTLISANDNFCQFIGYSDEELKGTAFTEFTHPEEREIDRKKIQTLLLGEASGFTRIKRYVAKNGHIVWGKLTVSLIHDAQHKPLYLIAAIDDITKQKEIEREKELLQETLQKSKKMEALATLAGGVAHDFNNALTSIVGNLELLGMALDDDKIIQPYVNPIFESTYRMTQLTNQLLAYAQGGKYQPTAINFDTFIKDNFSLLKHHLPAKSRMRLELHGGDNKIFADSTQMLMVLSAVIMNAAEAIDHEGKIHVRTRVKKFATSHNPEYPDILPATYVHLQIEDDGHGMDEATLEHIFEPFFSTKLRGRGLGMASVYGIIKNHDGYVYVRTNKNEGTIVDTFLPLHEDKRTDEESNGLKPLQGSETVLVVEDEEVVKNVIVSMLKHMGFTVHSVKCGRDALDFSQTNPNSVDIILLDMGLPDIPGQVLFYSLRQYQSHAKVILCSGYSIDGPAQELLETGADAFLQKPFNFLTLSRTLSKVMKDDKI